MKYISRVLVAGAVLYLAVQYAQQPATTPQGQSPVHAAKPAANQTSSPEGQTARSMIPASAPTPQAIAASEPLLGTRLAYGMDSFTPQEALVVGNRLLSCERVTQNAQLELANAGVLSEPVRQQMARRHHQELVACQSVQGDAQALGQALMVRAFRGGQAGAAVILMTLHEPFPGKPSDAELVAQARKDLWSGDLMTASQALLHRERKLQEGRRVTGPGVTQSLDESLQLAAALVQAAALSADATVLQRQRQYALDYAWALWRHQYKPDMDDEALRRTRALAGTTVWPPGLPNPMNTSARASIETLAQAQARNAADFVRQWNSLDAQ
ncbi:hypothetical protein ACG0Z6_11235 [Roseateles sp. BYS180W]|uniref:Secreted protein n=1 Tax=Roseateles rivi TaxID=3299028 RepID=A0ABW7FWY3_9BURK